jgi:dihydrofolate synthase/folylpolyglutamate synthase
MRFSTLAEWLAWQETLHPKSIDLGLSRVKQVFDRLGPHPERPFTITVGGTNGKGSCVAMLDAILRSAGYRVGTYTSPHLLAYNERIRIDGRPVADAPICAAFERIDRARGDTSLSFFEFGTLAALDLFSNSGLDVQVLEVGLGGRLDAVNIVDADVALLAAIDIDHQEWLGHTREAIGQEKAGIFRTGRPAVVGDPEVPDSVVRYAVEHGVPLYRLDREFGYRAATETWTWHSGATELAGLPWPAIAGDHQLMNAAAVLEVLHLVKAERPVPPGAIGEGLRTLRLAGRFQYFPGPVPVLVDVAHNPQSVKILADYLQSRFQGRRVHAVFAVMRDKDIAGVVGHIRDRIDRWYLAPLKMPRAATAEQLLEVFREQDITAVEHGFRDAAAAFGRARAAAAEGDLVLVFGSFFLVSEYLAQASRS